VDPVRYGADPVVVVGTDTGGSVAGTVVDVGTDVGESLPGTVVDVGTVPPGPFAPWPRRR